MKESPDKNIPWDEFAHLFKRREISARRILLREGEISKKAFFIEKGCMRLWFNNHKKAG